MAFDNWQDAVAVAIGAKRASTTETVRAFQYLHDTGIGYVLPGKIKTTLRQLVADRIVKETSDETTG